MNSTDGENTLALANFNIKVTYKTPILQEYILSVSTEGACHFGGESNHSQFCS